MENLLTSPPSAPPQRAHQHETRIVKFPLAPDQTNRTFMCAVLVLDIVDFFRKSVAEQLQAKERLNAAVTNSIDDIPPRERIVLDTGDGVAINFLGDPEDALLAVLRLARTFAQPDANAPVMAVRTGLNHGPVRLVRDGHDQPNVIGDGINVAQRVNSFAEPGQVLVSRSYYEIVTRAAEEYAPVFAFKGARTDKQVREHEIYEIAQPQSEPFAVAARRLERRAQRRGTRQAPASLLGWLGSRALAVTAMALSVGLFGVAALLLANGDKSAPARSAAVVPATPKPAPSVPAPIILAPSVEAPAVPAPTPNEKETPTLVAKTEPAPPDATRTPERPPSPRPRGAGKPRPKAAEPFTAVTTAPVQPREPALLPPEPEPEPRAEAAEPWKPATPFVAPAPPSSNRATSGPTALVTLAISPWGEVFVDGKAVGVSPPLSELELSPGRHRIVVRNGSLKPFQEDLELGPNETTRIKHKFIQGR